MHEYGLRERERGDLKHNRPYQLFPEPETYPQCRGT